jgi:hypothetical protein
MSTKLNLYINNDQLLTLTGVVDTTGTPIVGATISSVLLDSKGSVITGTSVTYTDVAGQAGSYSGVLSNLSASPGTGTLQITGTKGAVHFGANVAVVIAARVL